MNTPMAIPFIALVCGIVTAFLGINLWLGLIFILAGSACYIYLLSLKKNVLRYYRFSPLHFAWIFLYFFGIGNISGNFAAYSVPSEDEMKLTRAIEGYVEDIQSKTSGDLVSLDCSSIYTSHSQYSDKYNFKILIYSDAVACQPGDKIVFPAEKVYRIKDSENSFLTGYATFMNRKGFYYSAYVDGKEIKKTGERLSLSGFSSRIRDNIVSFIEKLKLARETRYFLISILTGDKVYLDEATRDTFSRAGISHILALSGFHIGIIGGIVMFLLFPLNFFGYYKLRYILTGILLWVYTFITGCSPSIVRACVMTSVFIIALVLERKNTSLNSLCLAGFIILLFSPSSLYDIGFQLSFICVGALILFASRFNPIDYRKHPRLHYVAALLLASVITTFASWIIVAYYFQTLPTMFLPSNILLLPLLPFYAVAALIYMFLCLLGLNPYFLGGALDWCYKSATAAISFFGDGFSHSLQVSEPAVCIWLAGLILLALFTHKFRKKFLLWGSLSLFAASVAMVIFIPPESPKGVIVCNKYKEIELTYNDGKTETKILSQPSAMSLHQIENLRVFVIDIDSLPLHHAAEVKPDIVVIGGKYRGSIADLLALNEKALFVTHPSLRKKRESKLLKEADSLLVKTHSLRNDRALKILF